MQENPKFQQIVQTGKDLFWKFGVKRVSIEEICAEANVSKVTYYKHFKNKVELAKYILQKIFDEAVSEYRSFMDNDIPFIDKIEKTIEMKMKYANSYSTEFLNDLYKGNVPELHAFVVEYSQKNIAMIAQDYTKAQKEGHIRKDIKIEFIMYFINKMIVLSSEEEFNSMFKTPVEMVREITTLFFYGIVGKEAKGSK